MNHLATPDFWQAYRQLPDAVRDLADRCFDQLKRDPRHASLRLKRVGRYWSVRVGLRYRALAVSKDDDLIWFWVGSHGEYDAIVRR